MGRFTQAILYIGLCAIALVLVLPQVDLLDAAGGPALIKCHHGKHSQLRSMSVPILQGSRRTLAAGGWKTVARPAPTDSHSLPSLLCTLRC